METTNNTNTENKQQDEKPLFCKLFTKANDGGVTKFFYFKIDNQKYVGFVGTSQYDNSELVTIKKDNRPAQPKKKTMKTKTGKVITERTYAPGEVKAGVEL